MSNLFHMLLHSDVWRHTNTVYLSIPIDNSNLLFIFLLQHPSDLAGPGGFRLCRALVQRLQRCRSRKCSLSRQSYDSEYCTQTGARQACEIHAFQGNTSRHLETSSKRFITISLYINAACISMQFLFHF